MNNIVIELAAEDRARLDRLIAALEKGSSVAQDLSQTAPVVTLVKELEADTAATAKPEPEPAADVTLEEVQRLVVLLSSTRTDLKARVREIVKKYAERVSAIPADKLSVVYDELQKLQEA